jgi:hypothetical protein
MRNVHDPALDMTQAPDIAVVAQPHPADAGHPIVVRAI